MKHTNNTILAVGAAGKFAGLVLPALAGRGATVRALIRDQAEAAQVLGAGASETAVGDLADPASMARALDGIDRLFYIAPAFMPAEAQVGRQVVEAARRAGVRRIVFSSVIHPVLSSLVNHAAKAPVEEAILESGMAFTFLHPALFFQNFAQSWPRIVKTGQHAEPWSAATRFSRVDYRDVAEVAAIALTEDRLLGGTFELCAEGHLNRHEVAALMGEALGSPVNAADASPPPAAVGAQGAPLQAMFDWYNKHDLLGNALSLRAILGREPRTLQAYFRELQQAA